MNPLFILPHVLGGLLSPLFFCFTVSVRHRRWSKFDLASSKSLVPTQRIVWSSWALMLSSEVIVQTVDIINSQKPLSNWCAQPLPPIKGLPLACFHETRLLLCQFCLCWHRKGEGFHLVTEKPKECCSQIFKKYLLSFIYLTALGLGCSMQDLQPLFCDIPDL